MSTEENDLGADFFVAAGERDPVKAARDPARLAALKQKLAANIATTPLFDADRFTRDLEAAYIGMRDQRSSLG